MQRLAKAKPRLRGLGRRIGYGALTAAAALATPKFASAQSATWTGNANNFWDTTSANWSNTSTLWVNSGPPSTNIASFTGIPTGTITVDQNITSAGITFNAAYYDSPQLGSGWVINSTGGSTISNPGGTLALGFGSYTTGFIETINATIASNTSLTIGGSGSYGNVILGGANTYTGNTLIENSGYSAVQEFGTLAALSTTTPPPFEGALIVTSNNALGAGTATVTIGASGISGQLAFAGGVNYTTAQAVVVASDADFSGVIRSTAGNNSFTGNIQLLSGVPTDAGTNFNYFNVDAGSQLTLSGTINQNASAASLYVEGRGTLVLATTPTYTGNTVVGAGGQGGSGSAPGFGPGTLRLAPGVSLTNSSSVSGGNFGNSTNQAVWVMNGGTLILDSSSGSGNVRTTALTMDNGATLEVLGGTNGTTTDTFGNLSLGSFPLEGLGQNTLSVQPGLTTTARADFGQLIRGGFATEYVAATVLFTGPNFGSAAGSNVAQAFFSGAIQNNGTTITFSATSGATTTIIPYAFVLPTGGITSFATYNTTTGITPLSSGDYSTTNTLVTSDNGLLTDGTQTVGAGVTVNSLTLRSSTNGVTLSPTGTLTVSTAGGGSSAGVLSAGNLANTIGTANNASGTSLAFGAKEGIIYTDANANLTLNALLTGTGGLEKAGPGNLILTNATNTISSTANADGGLGIEDGTVTISAAGDLGSLTHVMIFNGTLDATGGGTIILPSTVTVSTGTQSYADTDTPYGSQAVISTDSGTTLILQQSYLEIGGLNSGGGFTKAGAGTLELLGTGGNSQTGYGNTSYIAAGTLRMEPGVLFQTSGYQIVEPGATILFDSSTNTSSAAFVHLGRVSLQAGNLTVNGNASANSTNDEIADLGIAPGESFITVNPNGGATPAGITTLTVTLSDAGTGQRSPGGTVVFRGPNLGTGALGSGQIVETSGNGVGGVVGAIYPYAVVDTSNNLSNVAFAQIGGGGGSGYTQITGSNISNVFTGTNNNNISISSSPAAINTAATINSLTLTGSSVNVSGSGPLSVSSGGILNAVSGVAGGNTATGNTISVANLDFVSGSNSTQMVGGVEGIIWAVQNLSISSAIYGTQGLTVTGPGTLTLSGANTYTGGSTSINNGVLSVGSDSNLGSTTSPVTLAAAGTTAPVPITLNMGGVLDINASVSTTFASARNVTINTGGGTGISVEPTVNATFTGNITGAGSLAVSGGGILTLTGNNTFSGGTAINNGTVVAASNTALSGAISVGTSGNLQVNNGITLDPVVTLTGSTSQLTPGSTGSNTGTATLIGSVNGTSGATLNVGFNGTGFVDELVVNGSVTTGGTNAAWTFDLTDLGGTSIATNTAYTILTATSLDAAPTLVGDIVDSSGFELNTSYGNDGILWTPGANGSVSVEFTSVPEPSVLSLLGVGAMGLLARRRRRKTEELR